MLHVLVTSNHHQADISVYGHGMFSAYSMGSCIVYICCVEYQTYRLINCSIFCILTNVFFEIIYEPINVSLSVSFIYNFKIVNSFNNYFLINADKIIDNNRNDKIGQSNSNNNNNNNNPLSYRLQILSTLSHSLNLNTHQLVRMKKLLNKKKL